MVIATKIKGDNRIQKLFYNKRKVIEIEEMDKESAAKLFLSKCDEWIKIRTVNQLLTNFYFQEIFETIPLYPTNILHLANLSTDYPID